jgi:hypothetical protein
VAKRRQRTRRSSVRSPIWRYLYRIGLPLFLVGSGFSLMVGAPSVWFGIDVAAFYLGFALLAIEIYSEEFFQELRATTKTA